MNTILFLLLNTSFSAAYINGYRTSFLPKTCLPSISYTPSLTMKVSKGKSKTSRSAGNSIALKNEERLKVAGRQGTKKFLDPTKLFVGNLAYDATEDDLRGFFQEHGVPDEHVVSMKIIRDWKTGKSKGYGFVQFMQPMFATSALELIRNQELLGRRVKLDQGKKKKADAVVIVKKSKDAPLESKEDFILEEVFSEIEKIHEDGNLDEFDDDVLFSDDDDDDDDFQFDGVYEEEYLPEENGVDTKNLNREQRREAAKRTKRRIKPGKGFGID